MHSKNKLLNNRRNAFLRLLELIDNANEEIKISKELNSDLMVRQTIYIKNKYVKELSELLSEYDISGKLEAA